MVIYLFVLLLKIKTCFQKPKTLSDRSKGSMLEGSVMTLSLFKMR
jgi:hypothetical protein